MSDSETNVKTEIKKKERLFHNIDLANKKLDSYFEKNKDLLAKIPDIKSVVYNRIFYPIIYEINDFYYLGGNNLYFILKSNCHLRNTGKSYYYEAIATEEDENLGKSPIIPVGCPKDKKKHYPKDMASLEIKI